MEKNLNESKWWVVDAKDMILGRLSTKIADTLRGKNKPSFSPHKDCGDFVVVTNVEKIRLTGNKRDAKMYYRHSGYIGNLKSINANDLLEKHPERVLEHAVRGMLPKNKLRDRFMKKLKLYAGDVHPHDAQQPEELKGF